MKLDIGSKCEAPLIRDVIACYLIGPEILEESINKVVIHDLLSEEELLADHASKIAEISTQNDNELPREMTDEEMPIRVVVAGSMERMLDLIINIVEISINLQNTVLED